MSSFLFLFLHQIHLVYISPALKFIERRKRIAWDGRLLFIGILHNILTHYTTLGNVCHGLANGVNQTKQFVLFCPGNLDY